MDEFDEEILATLMDGKPRGFGQLLGEVSFSHNTLRLHLDHLIDEALINREKTRGQGPGRPIFKYTAASRKGGSARSLAGDSVSLPFRILSQICRFEKGGFCKEVRAECNAQNCPQIDKG